MTLEEVFKEKNGVEITDSLILLVVIQILKRDFYEANHILGRKSHYEIDENKIVFF